MSRRGAILQDYGGNFPAQSQEAQLAAASYYQRDKELAAQQKQQQQNAKAKEQSDATDYITGLKVPHIGDNTVDLYNDAQMKMVQDKLIGMAQKGASVNEIKMAAMPELQKIAQGYTIAKNEYEKVTNGVKDLNKDYPTGNVEAARNIAGKEMLNNIFEFDDKGQVKGYKDPSLITPDKNYIQSLTTTENLPKWYQESGAFEGGVKKLPLIPIQGGTTRTDKFGKMIKQTFTGHGSVFDEPIINDAGEQTGWKLKSEAVPLGRNPDGSLIIEQVMPKEQMELALSTPAARLDFQSKFNKQLQQTGVNPDKLDPRARDILERKFAYDLFDKTGLHGSSFLTTDVVKEAPVKNVTNVRVNNGGAKEVTINDVYGRIENATKKADILFQGSDKRGTRMNTLDADAQKVIFDYVGDPNLDERNSFIVNDNGAMKVYRLDDTNPSASNPNGVPNLDERFVITTLPKVGVNIKVQANTKGKEAVVNQGNTPKVDSKPTSTKTFNIVDPNTGKVLMKGVDEAAANKAKAKGYKVQ